MAIVELRFEKGDSLVRVTVLFISLLFQPVEFYFLTVVQFPTVFMPLLFAQRSYTWTMATTFSIVCVRIVVQSNPSFLWCCQLCSATAHCGFMRNKSHIIRMMFAGKFQSFQYMFRYIHTVYTV